KELRVALFTGNYNHIKDGVSLTLNRLVAFLEQQGIPVLVFGPTIKNPAIQHNGRLVSLPSIRMPVSGRGEYRVPIGMSIHAEKELEDFQPTLIHIATPDVSGYKALKWGLRNRVQVVSSYHTHFTSYFKYYGLTPIEFIAWRYFNWFYNTCTHVYVPSQSMIEELATHDIGQHMKIWSRGVNTTLFSPEKRDENWRLKARFKKNDIVVTFVSRLVWEKELATFVHSVQQVAAKNKRVKALIVGDGPIKKELQELMPEAHYAGFLEGEDLAKAYASSDIFMFPSHTETFGNVTLEAMSSGLPCIVADATGSKSLVEDGVNGFLAKPENKTDFAKKLELIVSNQELREKMAASSREKALHYEWDDINSRLVKNYSEALKMPVPENTY
ncbi:MAG: glycosyltransferase family 1 protein, partial [Balneolaceae bacterium]